MAETNNSPDNEAKAEKCQPATEAPQTTEVVDAKTSPEFQTLIDGNKEWEELKQNLDKLEKGETVETQDAGLQAVAAQLARDRAVVSPYFQEVAKERARVTKNGYIKEQPDFIEVLERSYLQNVVDIKANASDGSHGEKKGMKIPENVRVELCGTYMLVITPDVQTHSQLNTAFTKVMSIARSEPFWVESQHQPDTFTREGMRYRNKDQSKLPILFVLENPPPSTKPQAKEIDLEDRVNKEVRDRRLKTYASVEPATSPFSEQGYLSGNDDSAESLVRPIRTSAMTRLRNRLIAGEYKPDMSNDIRTDTELLKGELQKLVSNNIRLLRQNNDKLTPPLSDEALLAVIDRVRGQLDKMVAEIDKLSANTASELEALSTVATKLISALVTSGEDKIDSAGMVAMTIDTPDTNHATIASHWVTLNTAFTSDDLLDLRYRLTRVDEAAGPYKHIVMSLDDKRGMRTEMDRIALDHGVQEAYGFADIRKGGKNMEDALRVVDQRRQEFLYKVAPIRIKIDDAIQTGKELVKNRGVIAQSVTESGASVVVEAEAQKPVTTPQPETKKSPWQKATDWLTGK